jgi:hypothetical protein
MGWFLIIYAPSRKNHKEMCQKCKKKKDFSWKKKFVYKVSFITKKSPFFSKAPRSKNTQSLFAAAACCWEKQQQQQVAGVSVLLTSHFSSSSISFHPSPKAAHTFWAVAYCDMSVRCGGSVNVIWRKEGKQKTHTHT